MAEPEPKRISPEDTQTPPFTVSQLTINHYQIEL